MTDRRDALAKSSTYKIQLDAIRLKIWELDEKSGKEGLSPQENREYDALENADKRLLQTWRSFRTKNGLSNDAVS